MYAESPKTEAELKVIRYAYKIAEIGFQAAIDAVEPGVTEREVAAAIESAMRQAGAEGTGIDTMVGSGPNSRPLMCRSTFRKIEANDLVQITVAPRYEGYHAAIGRPILVGEPDTRVMEALDVAICAQRPVRWPWPREWKGGWQRLKRGKSWRMQDMAKVSFIPEFTVLG